jgi:hypothetical protein
LTTDDGNYLVIGKYGKPDIHQLRLTVLDAGTKEQVAEYMFPQCDDGRLHPIKGGVLLCLSGHRLNDVDLLTGTATPLLEFSPGANPRTFVSPTSERWYRIDQTGRVTVADIASTPPRILAEDVKLDIPPEHSIGWHHQIAMTQDGKRLFVGFTPTAGDLFGSGLADVIRVYETATWQMAGELRLEEGAQYLALSSDGTQLYMTNAKERTFAVHDAITLGELGVMRDVGISPSQILVPPQ